MTKAEYPVFPYVWAGFYFYALVIFFVVLFGLLLKVTPQRNQ